MLVDREIVVVIEARLLLRREGWGGVILLMLGDSVSDDICTSLAIVL